MIPNIEQDSKTVVPQCGEGCGCGGAGAKAEPSAPSAPSFVYAIGQVKARFPSTAIEREYLQVVARQPPTGGSDAATMHAVLSDRANRYLLRQMCWIFAIEGIDTYVLKPRDPADFDQLAEAVRPRPQRADIDVVVGIRGPIAPSGTCGGGQLPIVAFDQLYSFDVDALVRALPRPPEITNDKEAAFIASSTEVFERVAQIADNAGNTDEHRALNYLAVRYDGLYVKAAESHRANKALRGVEVRPSRLAGTRAIFDVIVTFADRITDANDKWFVRIDVTDEFPFLVSKLSAYYDR